MSENSWKNQSWICGYPSQPCSADAQITHAVLLPCVLHLLLMAKIITARCQGSLRLRVQRFLPQTLNTAVRRATCRLIQEVMYRLYAGAVCLGPVLLSSFSATLRGSRVFWASAGRPPYDSRSQQRVYDET